MTKLKKKKLTAPKYITWCNYGTGIFKRRWIADCGIKRIDYAEYRVNGLKVHVPVKYAINYKTTKPKTKVA
jgi:hypothetical protein